MMLLLDTNVWVDYYSAPRAGHVKAFELIDYASAHGIGLLYAVNSSRDVFYRVAADAKQACREDSGGVLTDAEALAAQAVAWASVEHMHGLATAVGSDESDVWHACKTRSIHSDYEDNLILAAAQRAHADFLVTGDLRLLQHSLVAALNVEDMLAYLRANDSEDTPSEGLALGQKRTSQSENDAPVTR